MQNIIKSINILGQFCGKRDISELTSEQLKKAYGITQADVMVLFGGSIMCGGDVLAEVMKIAHVEIPTEVRNTFADLFDKCPELVREANPLYASK